MFARTEEVQKKIEEFYKEKGGRDTLEFTKYQTIQWDFPVTKKRYYLVLESYTHSIEESYFWVHNHLTYEFGFVDIDKITDLFAASEHSTFFNTASQRIGAQQDKISQFLGAIGKMIKDLFQLVRELRILDERLEIYLRGKKMPGVEYTNKEWEAERTPESEGNHEITLKGLYVDMAEGGAKNPSSVFGMSQNLQYTTLPDLFFTTHPENEQDISVKVDALDFNKQVRWVLKRKLESYFKWKKHTYKELFSRKRYTVQYFRQHWNTIKMYIAWIKPYLRNIRKMRSDFRKNDSSTLVSAFEGSMIEIEFLAKALPKENEKVYSIIDLHFDYRTTPQMNYTGEGYQRAPLHIGELKMTFRGYSWTQKEIDEYKRIRELEELQMAVEVEQSLRDAMDALGDDIEKYLKEAGEEVGTLKKEEDKNKHYRQPSLLEPFQALLGNFSSPFKGMIKSSEVKSKEQEAAQIKSERIFADKHFQGPMWFTYKNYKKNHKMLQW
jgi:hypothetical protein